MSIVGLTDQYKAKLELDPRGRPVRLGYLQKGKREGFGGKVKLYDLDHFNFKAGTQNEQAAAEIEAVFTEVYGAKPQAINDVRIPVSLAGNFDIEKCAWMVAQKHTEKGSIFLAQSDGRVITKMRDESGRVRWLDEPLPFGDYTQYDDKGRPCLIYRKKLYPFQNSMAVDLILPELNEALFQRRISGLGVVTLLTHAANDIPTLIGEYYQILDELVAIFADPRDPASVERVRLHAPLRTIPLRLYRSEDKITSPAYGKDADPADRVKSTKWLLHWQLNPEFSLQAHQSLTQRTALLLQAVGQGVPLLSGPRHTVESVNADLLGLPTGATNGGNGKASLAVPEKPTEAKYEAVEADFSEMSESDDLDAPEAEVVEGETVEEAGQPGAVTEASKEVDPWVQPQPEPEQPAVNVEYWQKAAGSADSLEKFSTAVYQLYSQAGTFTDAVAVKTGYGYMFGQFNQANNEAALAAIKKYAEAVADGTSKKEAAAAAKKLFTERTAPAPKAKRPVKKPAKQPVGAYDD